MLNALASTLGIISSACRRAEINRSTHYQWCKEDKEYAEKVNDILEDALDFAETSLLAQIKDRNTTATIFYLKTKGKHRGYVEASYNINTSTPTIDLSSKTDEELWDMLEREV